MSDRGLFQKRWRYIGVFGEEIMLCAGRVRVGPFGQTFWAVWDRTACELHESTRVVPAGRGREVVFDGSRVRIAAGEVSAELTLGEVRPVEVGCAAGPGGAPVDAGTGGAATANAATAEDVIWTRKQADVLAEGIVQIGQKNHEVEARGVIDDSGGRHPRRTRWRWCAGVGRAADGRSLGWNLVEGLNDGRTGSERAVWVDGVPSEVEPVEFDGLDAVGSLDGTRLAFQPESERSRADNLLVVRSSYRQPFGTFTGAIAGIELAAGFGVMEEHSALW